MQELPRTGYFIPGRDGTRARQISRVVRVSARALFGGLGIPNPLENIALGDKIAKTGAKSTKASLSGTRRSQNSWTSTIITLRKNRKYQKLHIVTSTKQTPNARETPHLDEAAYHNLTALLGNTRGYQQSPVGMATEPKIRKTI